ncbi:DoxX family protein [Blastococcus saxobsidens]|uniref:Thiosulfate dehydrogenase [quinone] large subunit n=1 Tax=Blastococcus saxobsidens TaxID=138336 RepID=A0A4Q7Y2U6_9ACTN|nr:DoxX family protein [Blastococcus saxobsidens]RZU31140.1 thiosulfate dehydrogenase [quinone] large subunit [Blastococcus saxobsidens]
MHETVSDRGSPVEPLDTGRGSRGAVAAVRVVVGMLWVANSGWKTPPDFGQDTGTGLFRFTRYAVEHPVFPPYTWLVDNVVLPNFVLFGYAVLLLEAALGAFLLVGLATRLWAVLGMVQTTAITLSVLNAPDEFPWTYYLMFAAHVVLFATAAGRTAGLDGLLRPLWHRSDGRVARILMRVS